MIGRMDMREFVKRTWAEIDLDCVEYNYHQIRAQLKPGCRMMCVVKADAYGHGAQRLACEYERLGAEWFAVSNIEEAVQLRDAGVRRPILILGYTPPQLANELCDYRISQAVLSSEYAVQLSQYAAPLERQVPVHIKVDTGMSRIGLMCRTMDQAAGVAQQVARIAALPGLKLEGLFTHFAKADEAESGQTATAEQFDCFQAVDKALTLMGVPVPLRHCGNSGAVLDYPQTHLDMVRPGIILYGLAPSDAMMGRLPLKPVMQLKSIVSLVKTVEAGTAVSYGGTFVAKRETRIATVPIGYADGYPRGLSGRAEMLVCGKRAPVIGRVCMDQLMLDVTEIPQACEGEAVTVFGSDQGETLSVDEVAHLNGTINYEMVCLVGKRVPRIYLRRGEVVGELNYICPEK
jgi:alanine racemase